MGMTFEFASKRTSLSNCCLLLWLGLTLIMSMEFTEVSASNIIDEVIAAEVQIEIGANARITCFKEKNSSCLSFYREGSNIPVPKEEIHVLDESSIVYAIFNAKEEQSAKYICKCDTKDVQTYNIFVGKNVYNFQCFSYNFSNMTCSFTVPKSNNDTDHKLLKQQPLCFKEDDTCKCSLQKKDLQTLSCLIDDNGTNNAIGYSSIRANYSFILMGNNSFFSFKQNVGIENQHKRMIPPKPTVLAGNLTSSSVTLSLWPGNTSSLFMDPKFTNGLQYDVRFLNYNNTFDWRLKKKQGHFEAEIYNLQYPYHTYEFSVRVKGVNTDNSSEAMWSEIDTGNFRTLSCRPERVPSVDVGSFFIDSKNQTIRLYWKEIAKDEQYGPDFGYNFTEVRRNGELINQRPVQMDKISARFTYNKTSDYTFKLHSQNINGSSLKYSVFEIHARADLPKEEIIKIYNEKSQTYTIVWEQPNDFNKLSNLTLFTCSATELPDDCMGNFNFETLNKNKLNYTTSKTNGGVLNFALSKNYVNNSTGMLWATCATDDKPKPKTIQIELSTILNSTIYLQWKNECWYRYFFKDYVYNLTYCMTESIVGNECIAKSETELIPIINSSYLIEGLQPSTNYKLWIRMVSKNNSTNNEGPTTEYHFETKSKNDNTIRIVISVLSIVICVCSLHMLKKKYTDMKRIQSKVPFDLDDDQIENKKPTLSSILHKMLKRKLNVLAQPVNEVMNQKTSLDNIPKVFDQMENIKLLGPDVDNGICVYIKNNVGNSSMKGNEPMNSKVPLNGNQEHSNIGSSSSHMYLPMKPSQKALKEYDNGMDNDTNALNLSVIQYIEMSYDAGTSSGSGFINSMESNNLNLNEPTLMQNAFTLSSNGYVNSNLTDTLSNQSNSKSITKKQEFDISRSFKFLWVFIITMCLATSSVSANDYVGEVIPHIVELPIGGSVNVTCRMNRSYFNDHNSSCLSFFRDDGNLKVPKEHIHVVDDSSIVFMIRNATEQTAQYSCKCNEKGVYITNIFVGTPPTNVTDFQCLGYDFSFMTCNFTVPPNKIYTDYKLKFSSSSPDYIYTCNLENGLPPSVRICNITMDNNNYRTVYQYYNFELTASNLLGNLTQSIKIDQYNRIVPARPIVEVGNLTTNSVILYWMVNKFSQYTHHTDGLQYEIRLRPEKFDWFHIDTNAVIQKNKEQYKAEINNLQYSYRRYDYIIRVKTARANSSDETMWSEPCEGIFYTMPKRPVRAPDMDVGSFYIDPTEQSIRLYWQQLAEYEENGPEFVYNITEVRRDGKLIDVMPFQNDTTSATYKWEKLSHYQFKLQSQNQVGKSLNSSILEVHPTTKRSLQIEQIQVITKVYHNQTYTITWRQPSDMDNLRNFTLFWCISKMESQSQCKGTINFKHFDKYTTNHTTDPQNHTLNFAVSANYDTYSTGMMWAMCTADGATDLTKMDPETSPISSNSIKVQWSTECLYMAILEGYNLTYCKVDNHVPELIGNCINTEKTISVSKLAKEYIITDLDPFTTYKISILMYSKLKIGPMSNPVIETTTEDAPSPPRKLKKYNVTSDSVTLSWLPPKQSNGYLRYYTVWYKNEGTKVNSTSNDNGSEIIFHLGDLSSYSDYKVYVTAHTVKSSGPSNDIHFKTLIGIPSPPLSVNANRTDKELLFHWLPPKLPSGRVEFYEIRVTLQKNNESEILKTSRVVGNNCKMNIPCYDPNNSYIFDVRAVNVAEKNEVDYHTFSKRDTSYFNSLHQGGVKKRRHSNAEINASIGAPYQIHETTEKNIRHRHERENLKLIQTTEASYVIQQYTQKQPDEIEEESDEDFICLGGEREVLKILRQYKDASQYKLFHSPWQNGPLFACSETKFSKLTMLALIVIFVTMVLLAAVYYARNKYNKMSNIGLVIPEGLDDNINVSKGIDNKIERDEIIRSDELFYEKENHRLLSKVGNDSGFLNSVHCLDKNSAYACSDLQDSEKSSQSTDSVELNDITSCSYTSSPSHSPNVNIREISIPEERSNSPVMPPSVQLRPAENGYIKPIMMSNGYVQPQAFQNIQPKETPSFNGYTSLDAMGKPVFPETSKSSPAPIVAERNSYEIAGPKNVDNKDIAIPHPPVSGNICGYVTHKQLSDFGRLQ